ncbi:MAG: HlyD family efflux transporter periplasmic adaptor subunit [Planctomycetes bacterium]|nr:HlyD family efflux transporter periplasmic adaptor subunit [Planctomycetota bacterium]
MKPGEPSSSTPTTTGRRGEPAPSPATSAPPTRSDTYAELIALCRRGSSPPKFISDALRAIARHFSSPYAEVYVRYASEVLHDDCHFGPTDPGFWKAGLRDFLTDSLTEPLPRAKLLQSRTGDMRIAFLSAPLFDPSGPAIGAVALVLAPVAELNLTAHLATLEAMARLVSCATEFLGSGRPTESLPAPARGSAAPNADFRALSRAASCESLEELAFALTNDLCNKLGCEQVALGMVRGSTVTVVCLSGLDTVRRQSPGVAALRAAMEECLDAGVPMVSQQEGAWSGDARERTCRLHEQWSKAAHGDAVASIPLQAAGRTVAILSLRRRPDQPFTPGAVDDLRKRVEPFAPALLLARKAGRGVIRHALDSAREGAGALLQPGRRGLKAVTAAAFLLAATFFFGSMPYRVSVPCVVLPAEVRHVAVPFDGILASSRVMAGDRVSRGEVLAELDHRDTDQQRAELLAEQAVLARTMDRARAVNQPVEVQLAAAQQELVRTRLELLERRIEQSALRAPIDGVVIAGDLRKRVGGVVTRGEALFEVAPLGDWTLELHVPEPVSADLATDLNGEFVSYARPDQVRRFRIERVLPDAQVRSNKTVFIAEADVAAVEGELKPGMEGMARLHVGSRRIWWIALHRAFDYLRVNFWL